MQNTERLSREFASFVVANRDLVAGDSAEEKVTRARLAYAALASTTIPKDCRDSRG
jgi:hypothetical protein